MPLNVVIAGASGFLGSHLSEELRRRGHTVTALVRRPTTAARTSRTWDPYAGTLDPDVIEAADVVVNLAATPDVGNPHSQQAASHACARAGVTTTRVLAEAIAEHRPSKPAFLAGNAVGYYGDHGDELVTEAVRQPRRQRADQHVPRLGGGVRPGRRGGCPGVPAAHRTGHGPDAARRSSSCGSPVQGRARARGSATAASTSRSSRCATGSAAVAYPGRARHRGGPFNICCPQHADERGVHRRAGPGGAPAGVAVRPGAGAARSARRRDGARAAGVAEHSAGRARGAGLPVHRPPTWTPCSSAAVA